MSRVIVVNYSPLIKGYFDVSKTEGMDIVYSPESPLVVSGFPNEEKIKAKFIRQQQREGIDALVFEHKMGAGMKFAEAIPDSLRPKSLLVFERLNFAGTDWKYMFENDRKILGGKTFKEYYADLGIANSTFYETMVDDLKKMLEGKK